MATLDLLACVREMELERGLSHETVKGYAGAARNFGRHLGRVATTADLQTELVNAWLAGLAARLAPATILARKRGMTAVWNWAADRGLVEPYHPRRLRRVSCPRTSPTAWSYSDVLRLLDACQRLPGKLRCGIPANLLLRATLLLAWDSGLRLGRGSPLLRGGRCDFTTAAD